MRVIASLVFILVLAGCSSGPESVSLVKPSTWFGGALTGGTSAVDDRGLAPRDGYTVINDGRPLVGQITALSSERTRTGAIIHATGVPPTQGYYHADLVPVESNNSRVLAFEFRIRPPSQPRPVGSARSREVETATHLSSSQIAGITQIRVLGSGSSRTTRP